MALVIVTTAGADNANAYASLVDAEAYALTLPIHTDWAAADEATKNAALVQATRMLDTLVWAGWRANPTVQALQWPRQGVCDRENYSLDPATIPAKIRDACCEFAVRLIADDRAADAGGLAPETIEVGPLKVGKMRRSPVPASVLEMVREFLESAGAGPRMVRA